MSFSGCKHKNAIQVQFLFPYICIVKKVVLYDIVILVWYPK